MDGGFNEKKKNNVVKKRFSFISVYIAELDFMPNKLVFKINVCGLK